VTDAPRFKRCTSFTTTLGRPNKRQDALGHTTARFEQPSPGEVGPLRRDAPKGKSTTHQIRIHKWFNKSRPPITGATPPYLAYNTDGSIGITQPNAEGSNKRVTGRRIRSAKVETRYPDHVGMAPSPGEHNYGITTFDYDQHRCAARENRSTRRQPYVPIYDKRLDALLSRDYRNACQLACLATIADTDTFTL